MLLLGEKQSTKTRFNRLIYLKNTPFRGVFLFPVEKTKQELDRLFILSKLAMQNIKQII
ncbi:hypothetical protein SAMN05443549_102222 [Flavobacterium fluvii]|uniref:Uncharacterized protein n=1 Tax=Flavobacterium fluvii TaxID=468056 RepID=A0A1M5HG75_9FLAO|nr:hypothetical protein SAMN05443549_102222 [Flavobacterium fluvii]